MKDIQSIRAATSADRDELIRLICALFPGFDEDLAAEIDEYLESSPDARRIFVAERTGGGLGGFIEAGTRPYAEGCSSSPVGYVEAWFVDADLRRSGVGRKLFAAAEDWARARGLTEMASDSLIENEISIKAHGAIGYEEVERIVCFRRTLTLVLTAAAPLTACREAKQTSSVPADTAPVVFTQLYQAGPDNEVSHVDFAIGRQLYRLSWSDSTLDRSGRLKNLRINLEPGFFVERIRYADYDSQLLLLVDASDNETGNASLIHSTRDGNVNWQTTIRAFNTADPTVVNRMAYVSGIGFVGKIDLSNGRMMWEHDDLYESEGSVFNSFRPAELVGDTVFFEDAAQKEPRRMIRVLDSTGALLDPRHVAKSDFEDRVGLVLMDARRDLCLAIPNAHLNAGDTLGVIELGMEQQLAYRATIKAKRTEKCDEIRNLTQNDSWYTVELADTVMEFGSVMLGITGTQMMAADKAVSADLDGDGAPELFRVCTSMEGLHLTIWSGEPLKGKRRWHAYYYLGYDTEANCTRADYM